MYTYIESKKKKKFFVKSKMKVILLKLTTNYLIEKTFFYHKNFVRSKLSAIGSLQIYMYKIVNNSV